MPRTNAAQILELISSKGDLPPMPEVVGRLLTLLDDPDSSMAEIIRVIKTDPAMVGRILTLAHPGDDEVKQTKITDVAITAARLGRTEIRKIVLSTSLMELFEHTKKIDQAMFWRHSLTVALNAQLLSRILGADQSAQHTAYLAGLLHDIGLLVFGHLIPQTYGNFITRISGNRNPSHQYQLSLMEDEAFGIDHARLGAAYIEEWWPVDQTIIMGVRHHHPEVTLPGNLPTIAKLVITADLFTHSKHVHNGVNVYRDPFDLYALRVLDLDQDQIERFLDMAPMNVELASNQVS